MFPVGFGLSPILLFYLIPSHSSSFLFFDDIFFTQMRTFHFFFSFYSIVSDFILCHMNFLFVRFYLSSYNIHNRLFIFIVFCIFVCLSFINIFSFYRLDIVCWNNFFLVCQLIQKKKRWTALHFKLKRILRFINENQKKILVKHVPSRMQWNSWAIHIKCVYCAHMSVQRDQFFFMRIEAAIAYVIVRLLLLFQ